MTDPGTIVRHQDVTAADCRAAIEAPIIIGTAGWSIGAAHKGAFEPDGSSLVRYSGRLGGVEVNSSFYRRHRPSTWARWAQSTPPGFKFAVKMPREISHVRKLLDCRAATEDLLGDVANLEDKLAVLLLQLPPKLMFDETVARPYFELLRSRTHVNVVCEPRHPSWFGTPADTLLKTLQIARVAADPPVVPAAAFAGGWRGLAYFRLHGSPQMYRSAYGEQRLCAYAHRLKEASHCGHAAWCMFDNTASSAATGDALALSDMVSA